MSYHDESDDARQEREHSYRMDVWYDVWRSGRDPDRISDDRVSEHFSCGDPSETAAAHECRVQRQAQEQRQESQREEEEQWQRYCEQQMEQREQLEPEPPPPPLDPPTTALSQLRAESRDAALKNWQQNDEHNVT